MTKGVVQQILTLQVKIIIFHQNQSQFFKFLKLEGVLRISTSEALQTEKNQFLQEEIYHKFMKKSKFLQVKKP